MIHMKLQIQVISIMSQKLRMKLNQNHKYRVTNYLEIEQKGQQDHLEDMDMLISSHMPWKLHMKLMMRNHRPSMKQSRASSELNGKRLWMMKSCPCTTMRLGNWWKDQKKEE